MKGKETEGRKDEGEGKRKDRRSTPGYYLLLV
jgi:hypothetical protein